MALWGIVVTGIQTRVGTTEKARSWHDDRNSAGGDNHEAAYNRPWRWRLAPSPAPDSGPDTADCLAGL